MKRIRFIINPISGMFKKKNIPQMIAEELDAEQWKWEICFTDAPGHAKVLAKEAAEQLCYMVVAAGGDGTVNEIGSQLVGTKTILAILPVGSGNGLARRLQIPTERRKAIQLLNTGKVIAIDAPSMNGQYFFSVAGLGFDALVSHQFALTKQRGFLEYARLIAQNYFQYEFNHYRIEVNGKVYEEELFFLTIANSGQFGYQVMIAPDAELTDGEFELVMVKAHPKWKVAYLVSILMMGLVEHTKYAQIIRASYAKVSMRKPITSQIDGDALSDEETVVFEIGKEKLRLLVPDL